MRAFVFVCHNAAVYTKIVLTLALPNIAQRGITKKTNKELPHLLLLSKPRASHDAQVPGYGEAEEATLSAVPAQFSILLHLPLPKISTLMLP